MARINEEGQWIVLISFIVAISLFFLAIVISQSTLVGQTTSESVLDFSKADIQNLNLKTRDLAIYNNPGITTLDGANISIDIQQIYGKRKGVILNIQSEFISAPLGSKHVTLHYNDGITNYTAYQLDALTGI
jgi:hypothetical protein